MAAPIVIDEAAEEMSGVGTTLNVLWRIYDTMYQAVVFFSCTLEVYCCSAGIGGREHRGRKGWDAHFLWGEIGQYMRLSVGV